jgi:hypothetical protein
VIKRTDGIVMNRSVLLTMLAVGTVWQTSAAVRYNTGYDLYPLVGQNNGGTSTSIDLPLFDTKLGTLNSVTMQADFSFNGRVPVYYTGPGFMDDITDPIYDIEGNIVAWNQIPIPWETPVMAELHVSFTHNINANTDDRFYPAMPPTFVTLMPWEFFEWPVNGVQQDSVYLTSLIGLDAFKGKDPISLTVSGELWGGILDYFNADNATLTFEYTPVPEPSTYLPSLSALGMLSLFGFRNHKHA